MSVKNTSENIKNSPSENTENLNMTIKSKGIFAVGAVAFAILWIVLWLIFPMEWYTVFFASTIGSVIQLMLLAGVLSAVMCYPFSAITKTDIPFFKTLLSNVIMLVAIDYVYAIFQEKMFFAVIIAGLVHIGINILIFAKAQFYDKAEKLSPIKKQLAITLFSAVLYSVILEIGNILLFRVITYMYFR